MSESEGFYSLKAELPNGQTYDFEQLKGKVVLIVNVASKWYVPPWVQMSAVVLTEACSVKWIHASVQGSGGAVQET